MKNEKYGYIYITTNLVNNKKYIGQHKGRFTNKYYGSGINLKKAIQKYGIENFNIELIEYCDSKKILNEREKYHILKNDAISSNEFYNISEGGDGGNTYKGLSSDRIKEIKYKISQSNKGSKNGNKGQYKGELNSMYNKRHTMESRRKTSKTIKENIKNGSKKGNHPWTIEMEKRRKEHSKSYDCYWEVFDDTRCIKNFTKHKNFIKYFFPNIYNEFDSIYYNELKRYGEITIKDVVIRYKRIYYNEISDEERLYYLNIASEYKSLLYESQKAKRRKSVSTIESIVREKPSNE